MNVFLNGECEYIPKEVSKTRDSRNFLASGSQRIRDLQVSHFWSLKGYFELRACFHVKTNWAKLKYAEDISAIQKMFEWEDEDGTKQVVQAALI
jgi:hypothetical protein